MDKLTIKGILKNLLNSTSASMADWEYEVLPRLDDRPGVIWGPNLSPRHEEESLFKVNKNLVPAA